jgi:hypothetical protein
LLAGGTEVVMRGDGFFAVLPATTGPAAIGGSAAKRHFNQLTQLALFLQETRLWHINGRQAPKFGCATA